jgi:hypothetical protein
MLNLKSKISNILFLSLGFVFVSYIMQSFIKDATVISILIYGIIWSVVPMVATYFWRFFLLPDNLIIEFIFTLIFSFIYILALNMFGQFFDIIPGTVGGFEWENLNIEKKEMDVYGIAAVYSVLLSLTYIIISYTSDKK